MDGVEGVKRFMELLSMADMSQGEFSREAGVCQMTVSRWKTRKAIPPWAIAFMEMRLELMAMQELAKVAKAIRDL